MKKQKQKELSSQKVEQIEKLFDKLSKLNPEYRDVFGIDEKLSVILIFAEICGDIMLEKVEGKLTITPFTLSQN